MIQHPLARKRTAACLALAAVSIVSGAATSTAHAATPAVLGCNSNTAVLSTGSNRAGGFLATGATDLSWTTGLAPTTGGTDPLSLYTNDAWVASALPNSRYVIPAGFDAGLYYYRLQLQLDASVNTNSFAPQFLMRSDDNVIDVVVNGTPLPGAAGYGFGQGTFDRGLPFNAPVTGPWVTGLNTLVVVVQNLMGPTGLTATISGTAPCTPEAAATLVKAVPAASSAMLAMTAFLIAAGAFLTRKRWSPRGR